jgi:hypothetical protein
MTSRERVRAALAHREPDRIPFDLGGSRVTGIHVSAYVRLRALLGLPVGEPRVGDITQQLADVEADVLDALGCDVRGVAPRAASTYRRELREDGEYRTFVDEWGVGRRIPLDGGLYYDAYAPPWPATSRMRPSTPIPGRMARTRLAPRAWPRKLAGTRSRSAARSTLARYAAA